MTTQIQSKPGRRSVDGRDAGDSRTSGWLSPETLLLGLIGFLVLVSASVVGLLVGAAS